MEVGGGIAFGVFSRDVSAWIPAFAGMTSAGVVAFRHSRDRVASFSYQFPLWAAPR